MVNYQLGKIYKLVNNVDDKIYIGSTCATFRERKRGHKNKSRKCPDRHVYKHLNEIGWANIDIVLIEKFPCADRLELHKRERYWIDELLPELNKNIPTRTEQEIAEKIKIKKKQYYEANKEKLKVKITCECGSIVTKYNLNCHKKTKKHINFINNI